MNETEYKVYLPIIVNDRTPKFGVEWEGRGTTAAEYFNPWGGYKISTRWADVEETPGVFDVSSIERKIAPGISPTWLDLKMTPQWARRDPNDLMCKLPKQQHWDSFVQFAQMAINTFGPEYIGIWNEPDARHSNPDWEKFFGCVDSAIGYVNFVNYVANRLTGAKVVVGNVSNPDTDFFRTLVNGTKYNDSIYGYSYHQYVHFYEDGGLYGDLGWRQQYCESLTDKPVHLSETGVMYKTGSINRYFAAQVQYLTWLYENMDNVWFWYTLLHNGWPETISTDMMSKGLIPRPVHNSYMELR